MSKNIQLIVLMLGLACLGTKPVMASYMDQCNALKEMVPNVDAGDNKGPCHYIQKVDTVLSPFKPAMAEEVSAGSGDGVLLPDDSDKQHKNNSAFPTF